MEIETTPAGTDVENDLEAAVTEAVMALDAVRPSAAVVNVDVREGLVTLTGYVQSPMAAVEVERAAEQVPGVRGVANNLIDDGSLSRLVAEVLATDTATRDIPPGYEITPTFGYLRVVGWFTPEQAQAVTTVTQAIPGVRAVKIITLN
jgi:osmotically-inducible protein OsmY